jgi:hypothetical protein
MMPLACAAIILTLCIPQGWSTPDLHGGGPSSFGSGAVVTGPGATLSVLVGTDVPILMDEHDSKACIQAHCVLYSKRCSSHYACEYDVQGVRGRAGYGFALEATNAKAFRQAERRLAIIADDAQGVTIPLSAFVKFERYRLQDWEKPVPP